MTLAIFGLAIVLLCSGTFLFTADFETEKSADIAIANNPASGCVFGAGDTHYISASSGNDSNDGLSASTPWKTLDKVNGHSFSPGENILFKRDDTWRGTLTIGASGSSAQPILFSAYGTGEKPVISGFATITGWVNEGSGIYSKSVSAESSPNMVTVDGANTPMGRWPNAGWMIIDSATGNTSITDAALPSSPDWDGAELVIRKNHWVIDRNIITDHSGQTIAYISPSSYSGLAEYGYFIQGDIDTLDSPGEWFYDSGAAKFYMYFATDDPAGHVVKVSNIDELVHMLYVDYINLNGIRFEGANKAAFSVGASAHIGITHCEIEYCGDFGINGGVNWETGYSGSESLLVADNVINEIQNNGIEIAGEFVNATISNNIISNISTIPGMGGSGDGQYIGISIAWASGVTVEGNQIFNCGYIPLVANGAYVKIKNNYIHHYCYVKDDGGGIYTSLSIFPGREIIGNTVLYGLGALEGTPSTYPYVEGIYLDFNSADVLVANNTCAFNPIAGIYLHASHECDINNNTVFDNVYSQIYFVADNHPGEYDPIRNISMNDNVFVAKDAAQRCLSFATCTDDIAEFGTADNNCYARPIDDNYTISTQTYLWGGDITARTLETWQSYVAQDAHSHKSPKAITHANELRFEYNPANKTKTVALGGNYIDVDGNPYFGSVILLPHSSIVLIKDNTIVPESSPIVSIMMLGILISGIGCAYRKKVRHRVKPHL